jgi:hypothetical protein
MESKQFLIIDSRDRTPTSSLDSATFELSKPIIGTSKCQVLYCMSYNTLYNVTAPDNTLIINSVAFTITPGYYTSSSIVSVVDIILKGIDPSLGVSYNAITGVASFVLGTRVLSSTTFAFEMLGIKTSTATGSFQSVINTTFPAVLNFYSPEISCDAMRSTNRNQLNATPFLSMPLYAPNNTLNYHQSNFPIKLNCTTTNLSRLTIFLRDGRGLTVQNPSEYQIQLVFY